MEPSSPDIFQEEELLLIAFGHLGPGFRAKALAAEATVVSWLSGIKSEASGTAESSSIRDAVEALADDETERRWPSIDTFAAGDIAVVDELVKASFGLASAADFNNFGRLVQSAISAADPDAEFSDEISGDFVDASDEGSE